MHKQSIGINPSVITKPGDIWVLGNHRIMCGDSTHIANVKTLMQDEKADLAFTDPPYNVNYRGRKGKNRRAIANDDLFEDNYKQFVMEIMLAHQFALKRGASFYIFYASIYHQAFEEALRINCFDIRSQIVWVKNHFVLSFSRYKMQHELMLYCHHKNERDAWYGDKKQTSVWQFPKPGVSKWHPTMKPVALIERAIINSSQVGEIVVDLFGGSGSTLIACEQQDRKARLMEIDPFYVDATIRRWQEHTDQEAILLHNQMTFNALAHSQSKQ